MKFSGIGKPRGTWRSRSYSLSGAESPQGKKRRTPAVHTRFKPFTTHQVTAEAAARCGAHRKGKATHFTSEKQLRTYLANEKSAGRTALWKQHDRASDLTPG